VPSVSRPYSSVAAHSSSAPNRVGTIPESPRPSCYLPSTHVGVPSMEHRRAPVSLTPPHRHLILVCHRPSLLVLCVCPTPRVVSMKTDLVSGHRRPVAHRVTREPCTCSHCVVKRQACPGRALAAGRAGPSRWSLGHG
jgi:hypothetical protein